MEGRLAEGVCRARREAARLLAFGILSSRRGSPRAEAERRTPCHFSEHIAIIAMRSFAALRMTTSARESLLATLSPETVGTRRMPSVTLLGQSLISGVLAGGMYGLLAMGLSLSWGLLRLVNLSHFALAFLAAYIVYELGTTWHVAPWWSAALVVPAMFGIGAAQHWLFDRFRVNELASLLITFSVAVILEAGIQLYWTADFRRYETEYSTKSIKAGPFFIPVLDLTLCIVAGLLAWGTWLWLRRTYVGKALRAAAEDPGIAAAYGVNHKR